MIDVQNESVNDWHVNLKGTPNIKQYFFVAKFWDEDLFAKMLPIELLMHIYLRVQQTISRVLCWTLLQRSSQQKMRAHPENGLHQRYWFGFDYVQVIPCQT